MLMIDSEGISRRPLHNEIAAMIRTMIVNGELAPGQRIPEQALCKRFVVSRTPLREALKVLSAERLVCLLPNRGAIVVQVTPEEATDLIAVLEALEVLAFELACSRIDEPTLAEIEAIHIRMVEYFCRKEVLSYIELGRHIQESIVKATGNRALIEIHQMIEMRLRSVLSMARTPPPCWNEAVEDQKQMMVALAARNSTDLPAIARRHTRHMIEIFRQALKTFEKDFKVAAQRAAGPTIATSAKARF
jgi:DNA-binding GntR family transcriptional regulator